MIQWKKGLNYNRNGQLLSIPSFFISIVFALFSIVIFAILLVIARRWVLNNLAIVGVSVISLFISWKAISYGLRPEVLSRTYKPLVIGIGFIIFFFIFSITAPTYFSILPMTVTSSGVTVSVSTKIFIILGMVISFYLIARFEESD